jgi:serine/threonine protein kinase
LELVGSYTLNKTHSLLFIEADQNLEQFFKQKNNTPQLSHDAGSYALELSRLASAIYQVHEYRSQILDVRYIGCHHDIKPSNILVQEGKFILADFGLSKLKDTCEDSKTRFKTVQGWYLAPECESVSSGFSKGIVGRSSDIWSFGCILAEFATYLERGPKGIEAFANARDITVGYFKTKTFHAFEKGENPAVTQWLDGLNVEGNVLHALLIKSVRKMLILDPATRPTAKEVMVDLRVIALLSACQKVEDKYLLLRQASGSVEVLVESTRFHLWEWAMGLKEFEGDRREIQRTVIGDDTFFEVCIGILFQMGEAIDGATVLLQQPVIRPIFLPLRASNDSMANRLPSAMVKQIQTRLEASILHTEDIELLHSAHTCFDQRSPFRDIGVLAAIKEMSKLYKDSTSSSEHDLKLEQEWISDWKSIRPHDSGWLDRPGSGGRMVFLEHRQIQATWTEQAGIELFKRVSSLTYLLHVTPAHGHLRTLHCLGFYCNPKNLAFTLVFEYPLTIPSSVPISPSTLQQLIQEGALGKDSPFLDARFRLAHTLAQSVHSFHTVGWMHKNISSHNILFFRSKDDSLQETIKSPYLVGLNHSRPDDPNAFTDGSSDDRDYQHPLYTPETRFCHQFDFYSLGLVLLEIGLWTTLKTLTKGKETLSPIALKKMIIERRLPRLKYVMGTVYHSVVKSCLTMADPGSEEKSNVILGATDIRLVLEPLEICANALRAQE